MGIYTHPKSFGSTVSELIHPNISECHKLSSVYFLRHVNSTKNENSTLPTVRIAKSVFQILEDTRISRLNLAP